MSAAAWVIAARWKVRDRITAPREPRNTRSSRALPATCAASSSTGEKVRSKPATVWVRGRESLAICPASSRASAGSRPCSAAKNSRATSVRHPGPVDGRHRPVPGQTSGLVEGGDPFRHLDPERADITVDDLKRCPKPGHRQVVGFGQVRSLRAAGFAVRRGGIYRRRTGPASAPRSPGRRRSGRRCRPCRHRSTPRVSRPSRCSTPPGRCGPSRSNPAPRPAGQVVIPRPGRQLVHRSWSHLHKADTQPLRRSLSRGYVPSVQAGVCVLGLSEIGGRYVSRSHETTDEGGLQGQPCHEAR